jgi:hypothetical protein
MSIILKESNLHTLHDGSKVRIIQAKELIRIPIWNGNRIIDQNHVDRLKSSIKDIKTLDFGFRIVSLAIEDAGGRRVRELFIIDGQHRHRVLTDYFAENMFADDFPIVVIEKEVTDESEIISYFKKLNTQMAIPWKSDPSLIANQYIQALEGEFNKGKSQAKKLIRAGATKRPYLSSDKLREVLLDLCKRDVLKDGADAVKEFVDRVVAWNKASVAGADMAALEAKKDSELIQRGAELKFMLAIDLRLGWLVSCALV